MPIVMSRYVLPVLICKKIVPY